MTSEKNKRKKIYYVSKTSNSQKNWENLIYGYAALSHSLPITKIDLPVEVHVNSDKNGEPEICIQPMNVETAICVFKMLNSGIGNRMRAIDKVKAARKKNGDDRRIAPNIKLRWKAGPNIRRKHKKFLDNGLPEPVEDEINSSPASSTEKKSKRSKSRSKKSSSESEHEDIKEIPEPEEKIQSPVKSRSKSKKSSKDSFDEVLDVDPPVRSPVRVSRVVPLDFENPVVDTVQRTEYDNGEVEETVIQTPNKFYQVNKKLSPGKIKKTKELLLYGGNLPASPDDLPLVPDIPEAEKVKRGNRLYSTRPYYEGRKDIRV